MRRILAAFKPEHVGSGRDISQRNIFQGGNLKGITRGLDYIKGLGCSAVWVSPVLKNRQDQAGSCHGYGIQDFLQVDPRFAAASNDHYKRQVHELKRHFSEL